MKRTCKIFAILIVGAMGAMPAFAAVDNGCANEKNNLINPVVAMCSTHAYNAATIANKGKNFSNDNDRQNQRDIIALKTTVVTQQMKQQYDYLNSTVKRLKTQLQKAVLTTSLEAAGASSDSGSSSYTGNNRNIILAGAQDCRAQTSENAVLDCMQSNIIHIRAATNAGNFSEAYNQLKSDLTVAQNWSVLDVKDDTTTDCGKVFHGTRTRDVLLNCIDQISVAIIRKRDARSETNMQLNALKGIFGGGN